MKTCKNYDFCTQLKEGIDANKFSPPQGYNPIEVIRNASIWWLPAPFFSSVLWVKVRCLNSAQLLSLGDIMTIDIRTEKEMKRKLTHEEIKDNMIDIWNKQEAIVKASLIEPTFDEIVKAVSDIDIDKRKKELSVLKEELKKIEKKDKTYREYEQRIFSQELFLAFPLPDNFMAFMSAWTQGIDITDIKRLSRKMLLEAAILAVNGKDNPHDHISGVFTDKHQSEIDKAAWYVYKEYQEDQKNANQIKKNKYQWIGAKPA